MPRHRHNHPKSQLPISEPAPAIKFPSLPMRIEPRQSFSMDEVIRLLDAGEFEDALEMLDSAPKWTQREQEFKLVRATALMEYGDLDQAGEILREMERKTPKFIPLYVPLCAWFLSHEWPSHAIKAARKVISSQFDDDATEQAQLIIDEANQMIKSLAKKLDLPVEKVEQASWYNEQAQLAVLDKNLTEAERATKEAIKIAPNWNSPRNNYAYALYSLGKYQQAIAQAESVLANDPDNVHGLSNLVIFNTGLGHTGQAAGHANRLIELANRYEDDSEEIEVIISALALTEDTEHLWELAQRYQRKPANVLFDRSWHVFGVAASRLGKFKEAKKFLEIASGDGNEIAENLLDIVSDAMRQKQVKLLWPPMYPGLELLLSDRILREWGELAEKIEVDDVSPSQQRKIDTLLEKYPALLVALKRMLWIEEVSEAGADGLVLLNKPEADAEILRFASSDIGDNQSRMHAIMALSRAGRYSPEEPLHIWNADEGQWQDVQIFGQEIGDVDYDIRPEVADLIGRSQRAKDPQEVIKFLRRTIQLDPNCAMALHNLGVTLTQQGQAEEGEQLMRRSIQTDPTYTFGFASIGLLEANKGNKEAALDLLMNVNKAKIISPETAAVSNIAYAILALADENLEQARNHFETAKKFKPNHPMLKNFEERLELAETFLGAGSFFRKYQEDSTHRFRKKELNTPLAAEMDLKACLGQLTNDTLSAICQFWKTQSYGKKQPRIERLTERILDVEIFTEITQAMDDKERAALRSVLESGGWRPWKEFITEFGDDIDESPWWKYHDPESIPGRVKLSGLLYTGTLDSQQVAFIPVDVRRLVKKLVN